MKKRREAASAVRQATTARGAEEKRQAMEKISVPALSYIDGSETKEGTAYVFSLNRRRSARWRTGILTHWPPTIVSFANYLAVR